MRTHGAAVRFISVNYTVFNFLVDGLVVVVSKAAAFKLISNAKSSSRKHWQTANVVERYPDSFFIARGKNQNQIT